MNIDLNVLLQAAQAVGAMGGQQLPGMPLIGRKEASLTLSTMASMYGCCGLFEPSGNNDLLSLTMEQEKLLDWIGWRPNSECDQILRLLNYVGPAGVSTGTHGTGAAAACADAAGVEFGVCQVLLPDKGRIKRAGPTRDLTENNRKPYNDYPMFVKDGQQITDEIWWSVAMAGTALRQDLKRMLITGNASTANEFSGLENLVKTGYVNIRDGSACSAMDSIVKNWGSNVMSYSDNGYVLIDYIQDYVRRIRTRAMWANLGAIGPGDMVLVMPSFLRDCLLESFTCWSVCTGTAYNEVNMNSFEARNFRNTLNGGLYGDGQITIDGQVIPIIVYDWSTYGQSAPYFTGDIYILTRRIGNVPTLWGQYIPMTDPAARFAESAGYAHYRAIDDGRFLTYWKTDNECTNVTLVMRPNIHLSAPWACARIQNVACKRPLDPMSPDPASDYFVEDTLAPAYCPTDYLVAS